MFRFSHEAPPPASLDCGPCSNSSTNYVNIPVSPLLYKTRELLYTELELQKPSSAPASSPRSAERGNAVQLCRLSKNIAPQTVLDNYLSFLYFWFYICRVNSFKSHVACNISTVIIHGMLDVVRIQNSKQNWGKQL